MPLTSGCAVTDRLPLHAQRLGEVLTQRRLVEEAGGALVRVESAPVERGLSALGGGRVGDDGMRVQLQIASTRGAMTKRRDREAVAAEEVLAVGAAARPGGVAFEGPERSRTASSWAARTTGKTVWSPMP